MKKMIFAGLAALLAFALVTCDLNAPINPEEFDLPYVVTYDSNGTPTSLELSLDGTNIGRSADARAMSNTIAKSSYNFFEVVFWGNDGAATPTNHYARTTWKNGTTAVINGVYRTTTGITYGSNPASVNGTTGAAALFIGNENNSQLLAVGVISHVDGVAGQIIKDVSRTVTFTVHSLQAGIYNESLGTLDDDYDEVEFQISGSTIATFPAYAAFTYNDPTDFSLVQTTVNYTFTYFGLASPTNYFLPIRSVEATPPIMHRDPLFVTTNTVGTLPAGSTVQVNSTFHLAADVAAETQSYVTGVTAGGQLIPNTGIMPITLFGYADETSSAPYITSLGFEILVYAVTNADNEAYSWILSPGIDSFRLDGGQIISRGGCILLSVNDTATAGGNTQTVELNNTPGPDGKLYIIAH